MCEIVRIARVVVLRGLVCGLVISWSSLVWIESDRPLAYAEVRGLESEGEVMKILFLHHSTGGVVWRGGVTGWFEEYNRTHGTNYEIEEQNFPGGPSYGWKNYPYDYWNIWVNHGGEDPFMGEPTLEILIKKYDMIIWKHCFPVSDIAEDVGRPEVNSEVKRIENYTLHYAALKEKMREFPQTRFLVWTGAAKVRQVSFLEKIISLFTGGSMSDERAKRARVFFDWVKNEWDEPGDNIYVWDFHELETEGGLYLKSEYAGSPNDSHPNTRFAETVAPLLCQRIVDVIEGRGDSSDITGRPSN